MQEIQPVFEAVDRFNDKLRAEGVWVFAGGLLPLESATTVDATGATPIITDGPFAETKEHLGGFWSSRRRTRTRPCAGQPKARPPAEARSRFGPSSRSPRDRCDRAGCDRADPPRGARPGGAIVVALERWPVDGVPPNPGGWLTAAATRRAIGRTPLTTYHAWHATRADLPRRLGRSGEARAAYDAALAATDNEAERAYLARRRGSLAP